MFAIEQADFNTVLAITATVGVVAFAIGQFRMGRDRQLRLTLETAMAEIQVERSARIRIEAELQGLKAAFKEVREERDYLRSIASGESLSPAMHQEISGLGTRIVAAIQELGKKLDAA